MPVSKKLLALFFLAFILRVLFFVLAISNAASPETYILRFDGYYDIARNILSGNGFSQDAVAPFEPDSIRTPLYPLFLAFFAMLFGVFDAAIIPQIVVGSCIPLLAYRIARQLMGSEYVALWTAALLAVEPLSITFSSTFQVETLFTALLLSGLTVFLAYLQTERVHVLAASMVLLGFAVLARPTVQFLPLILVGVILFQLRGNPRRALGHSILLICIGGAVVSPWLLRNYLQFGAVSLSVQSVSVPYAFLVPSAIALEKKQGFSKTQDEFNRGIGNIKDVEDITLANMGEYKKRLPGLLLAHPVGFMKSVGVTALTFFTHDGYLDVLARLHLDPKVRLERPAFITFMERPKEALVLVASLAKSPALLIIVGRIVWTLIAVFGLIGLIRLLRTPGHRAKSVFILLVVAYFVFTTVAVGLSVNARFRMPVNALILPFALYGGYALWSTSKRIYASLTST